MKEERMDEEDEEKPRAVETRSARQDLRQPLPDIITPSGLSSDKKASDEHDSLRHK
jgi:hypothetical protein